MNHPFLEVNNDTRICQSCDINILNEIRILEENPSNIRFNVLRRASGRSCCLCNNVNNLHTLSLQCRVDIFVKINVFVPEFTRVCLEHLGENYFPNAITQDLLFWIDHLSLEEKS